MSFREDRISVLLKGTIFTKHQTIVHTQALWPTLGHPAPVLLLQYPYSLPSSKDFHEISVSAFSPPSFQEIFSPPSPSSPQSLVHSAFLFPNTKKKDREIAFWENWESKKTQHISKIKVFLLCSPIMFTKRGKLASQSNVFLPLISMHEHLPWLARQLARMLPTECLQLHLLFSASMCMVWMGRQAGRWAFLAAPWPPQDQSMCVYSQLLVGKLVFKLGLTLKSQYLWIWKRTCDVCSK